MKHCFFIVLMLCTFHICSAQTNDTIKKSTQTEKDSLALYKKAHKISKKGKVNKWVYDLIFKASAINKESKKETKTSNNNIKHNIANGKIIRNIYIETLDPFGYSVEDSAKKPKKKIDKIGNSLHFKTREQTIKNLLLFKQNDICDSIFLTESERLIRSQRYARKVIISPIPIDEANDSIDIAVRVLDSWTLIPSGNISTNQWNAKLTERNVLGIGHQISANYKKKIDTNEKAISTNYNINNIRKTYISLNLNYENDFNGDSNRSVGLSRPFFSPLTKNAGGIYFENRLATEYFYIADTLNTSPVKSEYQEYWYGRAFKLNKEKTYKNKTKNLIAAFTYNNKQYTQEPPTFLDPYHYFSNSKNFIAHIGISSQRYYQDTFIYNYDIIEDVPYGYTYALTLGYQDRNDTHNFYIGAKISYGKKFNFGYLSGFSEWGSFLNNGNTNQLAYKIGFNYLSPLWHIGSWKVRQFIVPYFIIGNNRNPSEKDKINLDGDYGLRKFTSRITGTKKWLLTLQTQTYIPKSWIGFRFSPYMNLSLGSLTDNSKSFLKSKTYSKVAIGVLINNDYLVFNSFQISFAYYPSIPFEGENLFKTNAIDNTEIQMPTFQLSKPEYIKYE